MLRQHSIATSTGERRQCTTSWALRCAASSSENQTTQTVAELDQLTKMLQDVTLSTENDDRASFFEDGDHRLLAGIIYKASAHGDHQCASYNFVWWTSPRHAWSFSAGSSPRTESIAGRPWCTRTSSTMLDVNCAARAMRRQIISSLSVPSSNVSVLTLAGLLLGLSRSRNSRTLNRHQGSPKRCSTPYSSSSVGKSRSIEMRWYSEGWRWTYHSSKLLARSRSKPGAAVYPGRMSH